MSVLMYEWDPHTYKTYTHVTHKKRGFALAFRETRQSRNPGTEKITTKATISQIYLPGQHGSTAVTHATLFLS